MSMNKVPTLILGIGGIGCRIAANINDLLRPEDRDHIAIVGMDTNVNDLTQLANRGIRTIQTSDDRTVGQYLEMHPEYMSWFPVNQFTIGKGMLNGSGQIRSISRLAALAAEENGMFIPIKEEIQRIRENRGQSGTGNLTVMVVGSITGGTGAGLFLQMPFYIRKVMRGESGVNIIVRGMFVGPDLTVDVQPSNINRNAVRVNGYACLKELNAMYMRQTQPMGEGKLKVDFYEPEAEVHSSVEDIHRALEESEYAEEIDSDGIRDNAAVVVKGNPEIPYDYLYLIEGSNVKGGIGNANLDCVESLVSRMVFTLLFTPVSDNALSVEDNMVLQDMKYGGMNRYSSAGLTRLVYPQEQAREYVTLCAVRDLVRDEWMLLDNTYSDEVTEARSRQRTDGMVEIPKLRDSYIAAYRKQVRDDGKLGRLYREAFIRTDKRDEITRSSEFLKGVGELIGQLEESDEITAARTACSVNANKMDTFSAAIKESSRVYTALEDYGKLAKQTVREKAASIANEIFPPSWKSMSHRKDSKYNIYQLLSGVHPLTARFLCYDMIQQMENRILDLEASVSGLNLEEYLEEDFDPKQEKVQTAAVALKKKRDDKIPVIGNITGDAPMIRKIKIRLSGMAESQCETISTYLREGLELAVMQSLLKRVEQLVENYRIFFQGIETMIRENNERIADLEALKMPLDQIGIFCSKEAFQHMAAEYCNSTDMELPAETKVAIFEKLFRVLATEFEYEGKVQTERQKTVRAAKKRAELNGIFRTAVVDTIRTDVIKNGAGIVDMNIRQAMERQYELVIPDMTLTAYIRAQIEMAMRKAAPMLATSSNAMAQNTESVYLAIHPSCAATEMGEPSEAASQSLYIPQACEATDGKRATVLIDEAFSECEMTCFKARYKFSIEDLVKYTPGSENARAYRARIANLGKMPVSSEPDAFQTVVNPHLNRYWHEEAYLPAIYAAERRKNRMDLQKAFIYAIGLDCFVSMVDESVLDERGNPRRSWYFQGSGAPLKVRGSRVGGNYTDLYRALPFNGRAKNDILRMANITMRTEKRYYAAQELQEKLLTIPFIEDLTQPSPLKSNGEDNMLDILLQMRDSMKPEDWKQLFVGLKEALWEFCVYLFDNNGRMVNDAVKTIMDQMYANCRLGNKDESEMTYGERELKSQVEAIKSSIYRPI